MDEKVSNEFKDIAEVFGLDPEKSLKEAKTSLNLVNDLHEPEIFDKRIYFKLVGAVGEVQRILMMMAGFDVISQSGARLTQLVFFKQQYELVMDSITEGMKQGSNGINQEQIDKALKKAQELFLDVKKKSETLFPHNHK